MPRVDLSDAPLSNVDLVVFVDGSASRKNIRCQQNRLCSYHTTWNCLNRQITFSFPCSSSGTRGTLPKCVNMLQVRSFICLWCGAQLWLLSVFRVNIANQHLVPALPGAAVLLARVAVMKCDAHTNSSGSVSAGNSSTEAAAKTLRRVTTAHTDSRTDLPTLKQLV